MISLIGFSFLIVLNEKVWQIVKLKNWSRCCNSYAWKHCTLLFSVRQQHFSSPRQVWVVSDLIQSITTSFKRNGQEHPLILPSIYAWIQSPLEDGGAQKMLKSLNCHVTIQPSPASHGTFPPNDSDISSGRRRVAWRTTQRSPLRPHLIPVFLSAVRQGVRLQHPPHVWQGGQADGLHPLQLHEGDPVQPAQSRRLPRWVEPSRFSSSGISASGLMSWISRFDQVLLFFSFQGVRFDTATPSCWSRSYRSTKWPPVESVRWVSTTSANSRLLLHRFSAASAKLGVVSPDWWRKAPQANSSKTPQWIFLAAGSLQRLEYEALG